MAEENNPSDKIDLASTELKVGGVNLKGAYIVWFLAAVSAVGGSIYAAGQVWGEYQGLVKRVDEIKMPDGEPLVKLIEQVDQIEGAISNLTQSLANNEAMANRLSSDVQSISKLMDANDVSKLQGAIAQLKTTVEGVSVFTRDVQQLRENMVGMQKDVQSIRGDISKDIAALKKDVDSQWNAIDSIGAGSLKGK
jgi:predicted  nucleic acid-binding Zn-ribbon protein